MKEIHFKAATLYGENSTTKQCDNLRKHPATDSLVPVGSPKVVNPGQPLKGAMPVSGGAYRHLSGSITHFLSRDGSLFAVHGSKVTNVADILATAMCQTADGMLVMTQDKCPELVYDAEADSWSLSAVGAPRPVISIVRTDQSLLRTEVDSVKLRQPYDSRSAVLSAADCESVGKAFAKAYEELSNKAAASGRFIQPVVARYRVVGQDGNVVYESAPVIITPPSTPLQATSIELTFAESATSTPAVELSATAFGIKLLHADSWQAVGARVELLVSPQLHPYWPGMPTQVSLKSHSQGNLTFQAGLPGASAERVRSMALAVISNPEAAFVLHGLHTSDLSHDLSRLSSLKVAPATASERILSSISLPHHFTADAVATNGDTVMWGALRAIPFEGYNVAELATSLSGNLGGGTPGVCQVRMADGAVAVSSVTLHDFSPSEFSPLLLYPDPQAVEITISVPGKALTLPLQPSPCGRWAYYLSPGLEPITLSASSLPFVVPASTVRPVSLPSCVAVAGVWSPLSPTAVAQCELGSISALAAAPRASTVMDFSKGAFYAFGPSGIVALSSNQKRSAISTALISHRDVASRHCIAEVTGGLIVLSGSELLLLAGSNVRTILTWVDATSIAYGAKHGEVWMLGGRETRCFNPDRKELFSRSDVPLEGAIPVGQLLLDADGYLRDLNREEPKEVTVTFKAVLRQRFVKREDCLMHFGLLGKDIRGRMSLTVDFGIPQIDNYELLDLALNGDLTHPVVPTVTVPHCHRLRLAICVTTSKPNSLTIFS